MKEEDEKETVRRAGVGNRIEGGFNPERENKSRIRPINTHFEV